MRRNHLVNVAVALVLDTLAAWLLDSASQRIVAVTLTLGALYGIGLLASWVLGCKLIGAFEALLAGLSLVQTIYTDTKRFLHTMRTPAVSGQRVVLISFPTSEKKTVGFVTKAMRDADTGRERTDVYVSTSPNLIFGHIEIVPLDEVMQTGWRIKEAMSFVMTGGASVPETVRFQTAAATKIGASGMAS